MSSPGACRFCATPLRHTFCDLGMSPPSNAYLEARQLFEMERFYPLHAFVCEECKLVQLGQFQSPEEIFSDYAYFSSYSESWLVHARAYVDATIPRFSLGAGSQVIEIASNDGYLLQYFRERGVPVLGIEPAANVAQVAERERGIPTWVQFFGRETARKLVAQSRQADLLLGNNVLAHVPDLNDFVAGMKIALKPRGVITMEFPHLLRLMQENQFDTIYHENFSYFSLMTVQRVFAHHGLTIFDVDRLRTHGGSLRIYARHAENLPEAIQDRVAELLAEEAAAGLPDMAAYIGFGDRVRRCKRELLTFLIAARNDARTVIGYGAPAKGNTLLNYCGVREDLLAYTVDRSPHKQGRFLPGTHIPIHAPDRIREDRPAYVLVLPWNLRDEITDQLAFIRDWGGRLVVPIPSVEVIE